MKAFILLILLLLSFSVESAVRYNPQTRTWEGNICMNNTVWQVVNWQPLGSLCIIQLPGHPRMQGIIINV